MGNPHVLVIPHPATGHVLPLMNLSKSLANHGFKITALNIDFTHNESPRTSLQGVYPEEDRIRVISIRHVCGPGEYKPGKLIEAIFQVMPGKLEELIEEMNGCGGAHKIDCILADVMAGWALEVAEKMGIRRAAFLPTPAVTLAQQFSIPKLIEDGIISSVDGTPSGDHEVQLSPTMPAMKAKWLVWVCSGSQSMQETVIKFMLRNNKALKSLDNVICNSTYDLEPATFTSFPQFLPIGPLLEASNSETSTCLEWLDQHPPSSVVYAAFGSLTTLDQTQLEELALGLQLSNKPFLWVVRRDPRNTAIDACLERLEDRVAERGLIVRWAPQQKVLGHPSVGCFISHCGWNSIMEGVSNGVPFLCWPNYGDQFFNETYVCDDWRVGLGLKRDANGIVVHEEIKNKVDQLLGDENLKGRALNLKEILRNSVGEGGGSYNNLINFIEWLRG